MNGQSRRPMPINAFCACIFSLLVCYAFAQLEGPTAETRQGTVEGKYLSVDVGREKRTIAAYLGIPFASPPIGELRFSAPNQPSSWQPDVKLTTEFGPTCVHPDDTAFPGFPGAEMWNAPNNKSEDCLYLNVWTPSRNNRNSELSAVMVWIFGGSFFSGTPALPLYDGRYLAAAGDVVLVSINYRLGPLGFMPPLGGDTPGNVGLLDQQLGLKWVRDNIRHFGGNPNNVTVFGESAGAVSTALHTIAPSSQGLMNRIILQSGNQITPWAAISLKVALSRTRQLAQNLMCPDAQTASETQLLNCLRMKSASDIFDASWITTEIFDFPFVPVYGTSFLPEDPQEMTKKGGHADIDILAGFNSNEGSYFAIYMIPGFNISTQSFLTKNQYSVGINLCGLRTNDMGRSAAAFMYSDWKRPSNPAQYRDALDSIVGHFHIVCPIIQEAKHHSARYPARNVYMYHLSYRLSTNPWPAWMGVMHGYEIELAFGLPMFGNFKYANNYSDEDRRVSRRMVRYWTNFAKFGNPNGPVDPNNADVFEPGWPKFDSTRQRYIEITDDSDIRRSPAPNAFNCAFWEVYLPSLELATSDMDELETKWKIEFHRWSDSMDSWDRAFRTYSNKQHGTDNCVN